jgi:thiol:disulfide interchange protein
MAVAGVSLAVIRHSWVELLPMIGGILQTGGLWFPKEQTIRSFALAGAPFWLFYNFISRAYGAALGSFLTMLSAIIALLRYRDHKT